MQTLLARRRTKGFSLLEVMIALSILVTAMVILAQTQSNAALMTMEAETVITATDLAEYKMSEVLLLVERDGFQIGDIHEVGDFNDFGDEVIAMEFEELDSFHWEYWISEVDLELAGDMAQMAGDLGGNGLLGDGGGGESMPADMGGMMGDASGMMGGLMSPGMITQMLGPYVREARVRVWWGEDSDDAEDLGNEVILTSHVVDPTGAMKLEQSVPTQ